MAYEARDGSITLFKNNPEAGSRQPHATANGKLGGRLVKVALWPATTPEGVLKKDRDGKTYMTGTIKWADEDGPKGASAGSSGSKPKTDDAEFFT